MILPTFHIAEARAAAWINSAEGLATLDRSAQESRARVKQACDDRFREIWKEAYDLAAPLILPVLQWPLFDDLRSDAPPRFLIEPKTTRPTKAETDWHLAHELQLELMRDPPQYRRTTREAVGIYEAVLRLRRAGHNVERRGEHTHVLDGRQVNHHELMLLARQA